MGKVLEQRSSREELLWTDHNPHSPSPYAAQGGGGRKVGNEGVKWSQGKKGGGRPSMGKEIRSSTSPTLLPPSAFAVAHA